MIASQFRLERELGSGGMGTVYLAEQLGVARHVVIKLMRPSASSDVPSAVERFQLEARLGAQLNHPHVVQIYVFGQTDAGEFYLAMEYVHGHSLAEVLAREHRLPEARVLRIAYQACDALNHAHHGGLVHRDLKPANLMICDRHGNRDYLKVLDFGIAKPVQVGAFKLTDTGIILGTPSYMAPEQARGLPVDARTDIYGLGCVLYELLGGETPFVSDSPTDMLIAHVTTPPTPLRQRFPGLVVQPRVEALILKCLEKDPADRFQSASELQDAIRHALSERPSAMRARPPNSSPETEWLSPSRPAGEKLVRDVDPRASTRTMVRGHPLSPWKALAISLSIVVVLGSLGLVYAIQRGHVQRPGVSTIVGPSVQVAQNVIFGTSKTSSPRTKLLWEAFEDLRKVQNHCIEDYFERVPREGPEREKRYYVGMNCPSPVLQSAGAKVSEADAPPLTQALSAVQKACAVCSDARSYYDSGAYAADQGARGRTLHASMVAEASRYIRSADEAERWVYRNLAKAFRGQLEGLPPGSTGSAFRTLVTAGYAVVAARQLSELSDARQQLEHALHSAEQRVAAADPKSAGALNSFVGLAHSLLTTTLRIESMAGPGIRLPLGGRGYDFSNNWRLVAETAPTGLVQARREQGMWFESLLALAGTLEELENYGVLR